MVLFYAVVSCQQKNASNGQLEEMKGQLKTLKVQNDGQRRQIRPFIEVTGASNLNREFPYGSSPAADISISQFGITPALNVSATFTFSAIDIKAAIPTGKPPSEPLFDQYGKVMVPDSGQGVIRTPISNAWNSNEIPWVVTQDKAQPTTLHLQSVGLNWFDFIQAEYNENSQGYTPVLTGAVSYHDGYGYLYQTPFCFVFLLKAQRDSDGKAKVCHDNYAPAEFAPTQ